SASSSACGRLASPWCSLSCSCPARRRTTPWAGAAPRDRGGSEGGLVVARGTSGPRVVAATLGSAATLAAAPACGPTDTGGGAAGGAGVVAARGSTHLAAPAVAARAEPTAASAGAVGPGVLGGGVAQRGTDLVDLDLDDRAVLALTG